MKKFTFASAAAVLTAGFLGLAAPAFAAPSETSDAQDTISSLQEQGYTVVVQNPNDVPLADATVTGVRQGPEAVRTFEDDQDRIITEVTQSVVFVDVR
ncbi:MAG: hypothetical protein ACSLE6_10740 [Mycobacterium sp.]